MADSSLPISDCESRITRYKGRVKWRPFLYIIIFLCCVFSPRLGLQQSESLNKLALKKATSRAKGSHDPLVKNFKQQTGRQTFRQLAYSNGGLNHRSGQEKEDGKSPALEIAGRRIPQVSSFSELL